MLKCSIAVLLIFFLFAPMLAGMRKDTIITPAQCRAARAWLKWSQDDLAVQARVSVPTVARFEREATAMSNLAQVAVLRAFTDAGITVSNNADVGYGGITGRL